MGPVEQTPTLGEEADPSDELISVIVCTSGRLRMLRRCLDSLRDLEGHPYEVIVVDNGRIRTVEPPALEGTPCRVIHEPKRGLDRARTRGVADAKGPIVAFIDDDCEADRHWLTGLREGFADPEVSCVTGRVRPASLRLPSQRWFEARFSFDRGVLHQRFHRDDPRPWFPVYPSHLGTGCNMAFRRELFGRVRGFDPALDMGTRVGGGGDLDLFAQLLDAGEVAAYVPSAVVFHHHRETRGQLVKQFYGYGATVGALCLKAVLDRPQQRRNAVRFYGNYLAEQVRRVVRRLRRREPVPVYLTLVETLGNIAGPVLYLWSRWETQRRTVT